MQTLNILDSQFSEFNAYKVFNTRDFEPAIIGSALLEQLQVTLELEKLLNIFAMEASKFVDLSGLHFDFESQRTSIRGNVDASTKRKFPLKINNEFIGTLIYEVNSPISLANSKILQKLHQYLSYPLRNAVKYQQAVTLAMQDALTGLGNRRYFDEQLKRAMHHAKRKDLTVGLIVCDLNKFKAINDNYGHDIGDQVLSHFAQALRVSIRDSDSVFRFGGDEFVILVEDSATNSLSMIESRIHNAMQQDTFLSSYQVTSGVGFTFMRDSDDESSLFKRADEELYRVKMNINRCLSIV
jgi:diguanylate cyclase (GGDEF)-like protein